MRKKQRTALELLVFVLPALAVMTLVCIIPFLLNVGYSFTRWNGIGKNAEFVGLQNFIELFTNDSGFWQSALFTIFYTVVFVVLTNVVAVAMAILLNQALKGVGILRAAFFIPNTFSLVVVGFMWSFLFTSGFRGIYEATGIHLFNLPWLSDGALAFVAVIIVSIWQAMGFYMVIYIAGLQTIPTELIESAQMDGAGFFRQIRHILLPMLVPSISTCLFLSLSNALKVYDVIVTLTGGGPGNTTNSLALNIYKEAFSYNRYGYGTAKSLVFFLAILLVSVLQRWYFSRREVEL